MNDKNLPDKKALAAAIEMEEKGFTFFTDSSTKAKDKFAREVFGFLASEELNHIKAIKKFNEDYLKGKSTDARELIQGINSAKSQSPIDELFKTLAQGAPLEGTDLEVYRFAMDFERRGEAFYKRSEAEAVDPNAKRLYGFLVGEERKHFKIVESCLNYFENPAEFFHQREGWHEEG